MRVTAEKKKATRRRILDAGKSLFCEKGFDGTTTRDITKGAQVAAGTLFNYFPSKEALAVELMSEQLDGLYAELASRRRGDESLDESLFALVAGVLRRLRSYRAFVGPIVEATMSPFSAAKTCESADAIRTEHLEAMADMIRGHGAAGAPSFVAIHLYWTLFVGVMTFWSSDNSPNQEDSLVLLDQSMRLFAGSIATMQVGEPSTNQPHEKADQP